MERPEWAVPDIDLDRPSVSRVYDYLLGGSYNVQADRDFAEQVLKLAPEAAEAARANRAFLRRAVQALVEAGIRQFLDIGSGIPTRGNVHEIAQKYAPDSRVVYVDIDPIAVAHGTQILAGRPGTAAIQGDLRRPEAMLDNPRLREVLDFSRPIGVLLVAVVHFIPDTHDPAGAVARLRDAVTSGSHLVLSHAAWPPPASDDALRARDLYDQTRTSLILRTGDEIAAYLDGWPIMEPGVVTVAHWRPEEGAPESGERTDRLPALAAVGVKP
jgi:SAM-dependent methyltransferase